MSVERTSCIYILRSFPSSRMTATLSIVAFGDSPPALVMASSNVIRLSFTCSTPGPPTAPITVTLKFRMSTKTKGSLIRFSPIRRSLIKSATCLRVMSTTFNLPRMGNSIYPFRSTIYPFSCRVPAAEVVTSPPSERLLP